MGRSTRLEDQGDLVEKVSTFTEQVMLVESSPDEAVHIYKMEQRGGILDLECTAFEPVEGVLNKWYITDETSLYTACSQEQKEKVLAAMFARRGRHARAGILIPAIPCGVHDLPFVIHLKACGAYVLDGKPGDSRGFLRLGEGDGLCHAGFIRP